VLNAHSRQPISGFNHGVNVILQPGDIYQVETDKDVKDVVWEAKVSTVIQFKNEQNLRIDPDFKVREAQPDWNKGKVHKITQNFSGVINKQPVQ
jgi:hypothetical protein